MKVGLITSNGGHLDQLGALEEWWGGLDRFWVSFDAIDVQTRLDGERVYFAHAPTNRHLGNMIRNAALAWRVLRRERPDVLISTGAGVAVPFFWVGALLGVRLVFVEVVDRVDAPSLAGRLVRPLVDRIVLQWEEQRVFYPEGVVLGPIL